MNTPHDDPFFQTQPFFNPHEDYSFDFFSDLFLKEVDTYRMEDPIQPPNLNRVSTDLFGQASFTPFEPTPPPHEELFQEEGQQESIPVVEEESTERQKAKSIATKNVCFNICQKTVKVIRQRTYSRKLSEICEFYGAKEQDFIKHIVAQKKCFTGPKALAMYVQKTQTFSQVFREFMRWFLKEKYLRHCLSGDMKDKQAYIKYKNEVILAILE